MQRSESRDEDFTAFVLARSARLVHIARMLCGDAALAEDLVQTALEKAYLRWDRIELGDPFGYVRQAVVNQHLSWVRQPAVAQAAQRSCGRAGSEPRLVRRRPGRGGGSQAGDHAAPCGC